MTAFTTLIKLAKTHVDEQRQQLARLLERLEQIEGALALHAVEQAREQLAARSDPGLAATYGAYVKRAIVQGRALELARRNAAAAVDVARDRLAELYEEQKRYELAEEAHNEAARRAELKRETLELDEVASVGFERRRRDG